MRWVLSSLEVGWDGDLVGWRWGMGTYHYYTIRISHIAHRNNKGSYRVHEKCLNVKFQRQKWRTFLWLLCSCCLLPQSSRLPLVHHQTQVLPLHPGIYCLLQHQISAINITKLEDLLLLESILRTNASILSHIFYFV